MGSIEVELLPHSPNWASMACAESARLHRTLGDVLLAVHHIGSTSIPGILAKPIVDLIPVVTNLDAFDQAMPRMTSVGYECLGEFGIVGRRYCRRFDLVTGKRLFQLHFFARNSSEIERHLAFANYLRAYPAIAKEYESQKIRAAALYPDDTAKYNNAKNDWIKRVEQEALAWAALGTRHSD